MRITSRLIVSAVALSLSFSLSGCGPTFALAKPSYPDKLAFVREVPHFNARTMQPVQIQDGRYLGKVVDTREACPTIALIRVSDGRIEHYQLCGGTVSPSQPVTQPWPDTYEANTYLKMLALELAEVPPPSTVLQKWHGYDVLATSSLLTPDVDHCVHVRLFVSEDDPVTGHHKGLVKFYEKTQCDQPSA